MLLVPVVIKTSANQGTQRPEGVLCFAIIWGYVPAMSGFWHKHSGNRIDFSDATNGREQECMARAFRAGNQGLIHRQCNPLFLALIPIRGHNPKVKVTSQKLKSKAPFTRTRGSIHPGSALTASLTKVAVYTSPGQLCGVVKSQPGAAL